jgi:hypothetical protein
MITEKTTISGTEEELLAYFKEKYNLVENNSKPAQEASNINKDPHQGLNFPNKPASAGQTSTIGLDNLFGGTSWGQ